MKVQVILPTAGSGKRFKSARPKALALLNGVPVFIHTLRVFENHPRINSVIVVAHPNYTRQFYQCIKKCKLRKVAAVIPGGKTRQESVARGLKFLADDTQYVIIHDGVRPLISKKVIDQGLSAVRRYPAVVAAVPVTPTIKELRPPTALVKRTHPREFLVEAQTPQIFRRDILERAHKRFSHIQATDDAMLVELLRLPVKIIRGDYRNIKITTREDLVLAEGLMNHKAREKR